MIPDPTFGNLTFKDEYGFGFDFLEYCARKDFSARQFTIVWSAMKPILDSWKANGVTVRFRGSMHLPEDMGIKFYISSNSMIGKLEPFCRYVYFGSEQDLTTFCLMWK